VRATLFSLGFPTGSPLSGRVRGRTELFLLPRLLHLDDQTLDGRCDADLVIGGTWDAPLLTGSARVRDARYENFRTGTVLEALGLDARARGGGLDLNATATDGEQGRVSARGAVDLRQQHYVCDLFLDACRLLRLDLAQSTATGALRLQGTLENATLNGNLTLDPTTIRLPSSTPPDLARIDIQEINANATRPRTPPRPAAFTTALDLRLGIPARMHVQGRGLDSEWSGQIHVGGSQERPALNGEMTLLRGKFEFLDRIFELTKGVLTLDGDTPPNPYLDVLGETQILDTLVQVRLNGPTRDFRLTLSSVPMLPQDELLSMILFGRSQRQISPLQAVRLAQAAAELTGVGAAPDVLGAIKSRLGLQEVDVSKDDNDDTAIGIGGYVGGKYYVRTQRSVSGKDSTKVEVQLTPKISVETEIGSDSRQGGGVSWKHDY
jgi:translocation and assembly module TamB